MSVKQHTCGATAAHLWSVWCHGKQFVHSIVRSAINYNSVYKTLTKPNSHCVTDKKLR